MVCAQTHSERSTPLVMAASGKAGISLSLERARIGKTRPETTSATRIRRRAQTVRSREFSKVFTETSGRASTAGAADFRSRNLNSRGKSRLSRGASPVRGALTLDEAFVIPINAPPMMRQGIDNFGGDATGRLGTSSVTFGDSKVLDGLAGTAPSPTNRGRLPSAMRKSRGGGSSRGGSSGGGNSLQYNENNNVLSNNGSGSFDNGFGSSQEIDDCNSSRRGAKKKKKKGASMRSLACDGSLFLGSGLGLRKSVT